MQPAPRVGSDPLDREQQKKKVAMRLWTEAVEKRREDISLLQSEHPRAERVDAVCLRHLGRAWGREKRWPLITFAVAVPGVVVWVGTGKRKERAKKTMKIFDFVVALLRKEVELVSEQETDARPGTRGTGSLFERSQTVSSFVHFLGQLRPLSQPAHG
jgi:hypothetical protein